MRVAAAVPAFLLGMWPNGDFSELPDTGGSMGEDAADGEPERGCVGLGPSCGR